MQLDLGQRDRERVVVGGGIVDAVELRTEHPFAGPESVLVHDRHRGVESDLEEPHVDHHRCVADLDVRGKAVVAIR